jgi:hypothetical protein
MRVGGDLGMCPDVSNDHFNPVRSCFILGVTSSVQMATNVPVLQFDCNGLFFALTIPNKLAHFTDLGVGSICKGFIHCRFGPDLHQVQIGEEQGFGVPQHAMPAFSVSEEVVYQASGDDLHELTFVVPWKHYQRKETHGKRAPLGEGC